MILVLAGLLLLFSQLPLGTALTLGNDEGYELLKGFMCWHGYSLYTHIWNDQPPVYTMILLWAFKVFGPSLVVARIIAAGFGLLLMGCLYWLTCRRIGVWAAVLAVFFLLSAPYVMLISVSVMLEVPAIALGLLSACLLFQWKKSRRIGWLLVSGGVMGLAMQVKYTAVLVAPAILAEVVITELMVPSWPWIKRSILAIFQWGGAALLVFGLVVLLWAQESFRTAWESHVQSHSVAGFGGPDDFPFQWQLFRVHAECVATAIVAVWIVYRRKCWREFTFPFVMLLTCLVIHSVHRPWWPYYYLHLAVPLAWFAGYVIKEALAAVSNLLSAKSFSLLSLKTWQGLMLCGLIAFVIVRSERRLEGSLADIRSRRIVDESLILTKMKEYSALTHWVYAEEDIYPFDAKLKVPPELTVVMLKRFWSGQMSVPKLIDICRRYQVEQLLLYKGTLTNNEWREFTSDYSVIAETDNLVLLVAKRVIKTNSTRQS